MNYAERATSIILDKLEGGYFHPSMLLDGRLPSRGSHLYSKSGETYGGLDRLAGRDIFYFPAPKTVETSLRMLQPSATSSWIQRRQDFKDVYSRDFWRFVDSYTSRYRLPWNYKFEGQSAQYVSHLVSQIMLQEFYRYLNRFCPPPLKALIFQDRFLFLHLFYATWNGQGWFKRFCSSLESVRRATGGNLYALRKRAFDDRATSSFIQIRKAAHVL